MKICIVTHSVDQGDGQGRVNYEVVLEAIRRGHQVTLLASQVNLALQTHPQVNWIPIEVTGIPTALLSNLVFSYQSARWLAQHRQQFDIVKVNGSITSAPSDVNAIHFVHSSWLQSPVHIAKQRRDYYGAYHWLYTKLNAFWEKQALRQTQLVIAVSNQVKQDLQRIGVPGEKIQVVLNGVDLAEFQPGQSDRQDWGLPEHVPLALFVGDIRTPRKNLDTVLRAIAEVPHIHLAVVGNVKGSPYPDLAAQLKIGERVHFLGYRRDVAKIMRAVDCFVFPSRYEACTLVLLEAMASGLPVITAQTAGGCEIVHPDCGVVLTDSEDQHQLAQALLQMTQDPITQQRMGQAARRIAESLSWAQMAQQYINAFECLASPSSCAENLSGRSGLPIEGLKI
jgi:glycosyltransferase involved in cell wall biosynthesis